MALQRTFSGFPTGCPGLGLLLLRLVVGGTASSQAWLLIAANHGVMSACVVAALLAFVTGLAIVIGFMTPIASVLLSAGGLLLTVDSSTSGHLPLFESGLARLEFIAISTALISLGPGALSLDARLYGRREIEVKGHGSRTQRFGRSGSAIGARALICRLRVADEYPNELVPYPLSS